MEMALFRFRKTKDVRPSAVTTGLGATGTFSGLHETEKEGKFTNVQVVGKKGFILLISKPTNKGTGTENFFSNVEYIQTCCRVRPGNAISHDI
jgi:hypothetical protein